MVYSLECDWSTHMNLNNDQAPWYDIMHVFFLNYVCIFFRERQRQYREKIQWTDGNKGIEIHPKKSVARDIERKWLITRLTYRIISMFVSWFKKVVEERWKKNGMLY